MSKDVIVSHYITKHTLTVLTIDGVLKPIIKKSKLLEVSKEGGIEVRVANYHRLVYLPLYRQNGTKMSNYRDGRQSPLKFYEDYDKRTY